MFPASLLARLIVKGSLKNAENGFEMRLKNIIDSGTLVGLGPLVVDDIQYAPSSYKVKTGETEVRADQITRTTPLPVRSFVEISITVEGSPLQAGLHKLGFLIYTREVGRIQFNLTEPLS